MDGPGLLRGTVRVCEGCGTSVRACTHSGDTCATGYIGTGYREREREREEGRQSTRVGNAL